MIEEKNSGFMSGPVAEGTKLAAQQAMHSQYVLQLLQLQRRAGFLCDITINIEEKSFKAHKPLLAACSLYFRALFAECGTAKPTTLNLQLSADGFEVLLDYIYSGSLAITSENSDRVLHAANCLQMTNVVETCLNFVRSSFKAISGETLKPGRPDGLDLPITLHGSEATKNANILNQAQIQANALHVGVGSENILNQNLPLQAVSIQSDKLNASVNNAMEGIRNTSRDTHMDTATDAASIVSPTSETLTMIMPYLVAKNARRPTLSEVRQLLSNPNSTSSEQMETNGIDQIKSLPPRLIPAHLERNQDADKQKQQSRNPSQANHIESHKVHFGAVGVEQNLSGESNIASRATVNAGHIASQNNTKPTSKDIQPFVMVSLPNNDLLVTKPDDICKSSAWSDDRSVKNDRLKDQLQTHLSSTPCPANLTINTSCIDTIISQRRLYPAASPESFGSIPSIEISPRSDASESPNGEVTLPLKLRWARAQSLDCAKATAVHAPENSPTKNAEEIRSSSLSPRFFRNDSPGSDGQSSLISAEEAASAAGALLIKGPIKKRRLSSSFENDMARLKDDKETGRSVNREDADSNGPMARKIVASPDIHPVANHISTSPPHDGLLIKQEFVYTPSTSPPTEESYSIMDQDDALSRSTTPSVATTASHDDVVDENGVLDLSVQKTYNKATIQKPTSLPLLVAGNDAESVPKDPKTREALDALVMMQTSSAASTFDGQSFVSPSSEDGKPRRSSGGQTCHWPGCGRLFRHRNIFEEHLKLHEIGVPVTKLRRCYMGARVKKTARERLDEMRSVEGATNVQHSVSDHNDANAPAQQRASHKRKRAPASQAKEGADRKRVTAKDRKDHLARNNSWQQHQTQASIQHTPLYLRPPAVPLSVFHTAPLEGSHHQQSSWPMRVQAPALVNGAAHMNLMNYHSTAGAGIPTVLTQGRNCVAATNADSDHNTTVVQALTALGIPIPSTNRDSSLMEKSPQRSCIPGAVLTSPNSGVVLDQLRRSIALREAPDAALALSGDSRLGNVPRSKYSSNVKAVATSASAHSTRPGPNSYHSSSVVQRVAKI